MREFDHSRRGERTQHDSVIVAGISPEPALVWVSAARDEVSDPHSIGHNGGLGEHTDQPGGRSTRQRRPVWDATHDSSSSEWMQPRYRAQQCCLPTAVGAEDGGNPTGREGNTDVVENPRAVVTHRDLLGDKPVVGHWGPLRSVRARSHRTYGAPRMPVTIPTGATSPGIANCPATSAASVRAAPINPAVPTAAEPGPTSPPAIAGAHSAINEIGPVTLVASATSRTAAPRSSPRAALTRTPRLRARASPSTSGRSIRDRTSTQPAHTAVPTVRSPRLSPRTSATLPTVH